MSKKINFKKVIKELEGCDITGGFAVLSEYLDLSDLDVNNDFSVEIEEANDLLWFYIIYKLEADLTDYGIEAITVAPNSYATQEEMKNICKDLEFEYKEDDYDLAGEIVDEISDYVTEDAERILNTYFEKVNYIWEIQMTDGTYFSTDVEKYNPNVNIDDEMYLGTKDSNKDVKKSKGEVKMTKKLNNDEKMEIFQEMKKMDFLMAYETLVEAFDLGDEINVSFYQDEDYVTFEFELEGMDDAGIESIEWTAKIVEPKIGDDEACIDLLNKFGVDAENFENDDEEWFEELIDAFFEHVYGWEPNEIEDYLCDSPLYNGIWNIRFKGESGLYTISSLMKKVFHDGE